MNPQEALTADVHRTEELIAALGRVDLLTNADPHVLREVTEEIRWGVCNALTEHCCDDPRFAQLDALVAQCDPRIVDASIGDRLRCVLKRIVARERFGLPFGSDLNGSGVSTLRGAFLLVHQYTFREDLPYDGDRQKLSEIIALFPGVLFSGK